MKNDNIIELLKNSGRANDSLVVHLSPISAAILKSHGGLGTINPVTELPEYWGWGDFAKVFIPVVMIAVAVFAPELIPAIGAYISGSEAAAVAILATDGSAAAVGGALAAAGVETSVATVSAAGAAAVGAGSNAINTAAQGGSAEDIAKSAVVGGVSGGVGSQIGSIAAEAVPSLGATGAAAVGGAAKGAISPALSGGSVGAGAAGGAIGSALGTEIGGDAGKIIGGAAGSATGAQVSGGDVGQSALTGGLYGAANALGGALKQTYNPQTGQVVNVPQPYQTAQNVTLGEYDPKQYTDAPTSSNAATPLPQGVMWNPEVNQYTYADGRVYEPTLSDNTNSGLYLADVNVSPSTKQYYSGGGSSTSLGGALGTQTSDPLDAGSLDVSGNQTSMIDATGTTQKNQSSSGDKPQLISPTIVPSAGGTPQVLSSVLGAPSSTILGQALQSSNPDPSTTGSPILDGDGKNVRNVWNTESLRTALGL